MEKLYDVLISHFRGESSKLPLFGDTIKGLQLSDHSLYRAAKSIPAGSEFILYSSEYSSLKNLDLSIGDIFYVKNPFAEIKIKLTVINKLTIHPQTSLHYIQVRRDA